MIFSKDEVGKTPRFVDPLLSSHKLGWFFVALYSKRENKANAPKIINVIFALFSKRSFLIFLKRIVPKYMASAVRVANARKTPMKTKIGLYMLAKIPAAI